MHRRVIVIIAATLGLLAMAAWQGPGSLSAAGASETPTPVPTEGPNRKEIIQVPFTSYDWWVNSWQTNQVICELWIEHEGLPKASDIASYCDPAVFKLWASTTACPQVEAGGPITKCTGVYMHLVGSQQAVREVTVDLPPPTVWVSISGCDLAPPKNRCESLPDLVLTGEEPLPNETIISIHGLLGGDPFSCPGDRCVIPLPPTGIQGKTVEFWADSSYGDSSKHYTALVRAVPWGDFMSPEGKPSDQQVWYVDVLSTQWQGAPAASCAETWESFPDLGGPPQWLTTPDRAEDLATNQPLYFLAGVLIESGEVDTSDCPLEGLAGPGVANKCGLDEGPPQNASLAEPVRRGDHPGGARYGGAGPIDEEHIRPGEPVLARDLPDVP